MSIECDATFLPFFLHVVTVTGLVASVYNDTQFLFINLFSTCVELHKYLSQRCCGNKENVFL